MKDTRVLRLNRVGREIHRFEERYAVLKDAEDVFDVVTIWMKGLVSYLDRKVQKQL